MGTHDMNQFARRHPFSGFLLFLLSFIIAIGLSVFPLSSSFSPYWPLWIVLVLIFWTVHLPMLIKPWMVWCLGIFIDVLFGGWLGVHALAFIIVYFFALKMSSAIKAFQFLSQMGRMLLLLSLYQMTLYLLQANSWLDILWFFPPIITSLIIWPCVFSILRHWAGKFYIHYL